MTDLETGLAETASPTAGPYVHIGCTPVYTGIQRYRDETDLGSSMINDETKGQRIRIFGTILDGRNDAVKDGLAEIRHADHAGLYAGMDGFGRCPDPNFSFWGRQPTDHETGAFEFRTNRTQTRKTRYCRFPTWRRGAGRSSLQAVMVTTNSTYVCKAKWNRSFLMSRAEQCLNF